MATKKNQGSEERSGQSQQDDKNLKQREYRDEKGEVHHHTHKYMEEHQRGGGKKRGEEE